MSTRPIQPQKRDSSALQQSSLQHRMNTEKDGKKKEKKNSLRMHYRSSRVRCNRQKGDYFSHPVSRTRRTWTFSILSYSIAGLPLSLSPKTQKRAISLSTGGTEREEFIVRWTATSVLWRQSHTVQSTDKVYNTYIQKEFNWQIKYVGSISFIIQLG